MNALLKDLKELGKNLEFQAPVPVTKDEAKSMFILLLGKYEINTSSLTFDENNIYLPKDNYAKGISLYDYKGKENDTSIAFNLDYLARLENESQLLTKLLFISENIGLDSKGYSSKYSYYNRVDLKVLNNLNKIIDLIGKDNIIIDEKGRRIKINSEVIGVTLKDRLYNNRRYFGFKYNKHDDTTQGCYVQSGNFLELPNEEGVFLNLDAIYPCSYNVAYGGHNTDRDFTSEFLKGWQKMTEEFSKFKSSQQRQ